MFIIKKKRKESKKVSLMMVMYLSPAGLAYPLWDA
jgi:hypothetical protein